MPFVLYLTALATVLALFVYLWTAIRVARARARFGVQAPAITGPEEFNRVFRVQQNTLEQLVLFLPALWLCYILFHSVWSALFGLLWPIARIIYALSYTRDAGKRHVGFGLGMFVSLGLLIAALVGSVIGLL